MTERDERHARRPEFAGGVAIRLDDGQEWAFPRPRVGLVPAGDGTGPLRFGSPVRSFGAAYDGLLDAFLEADDGNGELAALQGQRIP